ncbi:hypothetical protein [Maribacter sp. R86514]|uniref:hypothetical protein n=1 Tax=Maribacter sp. R86514 TaxID=3093854 RepID=UPI0037C9022B
MKTSIILLALIILNTSALLSETLASLVKGINPWFLVGLEIILLLIFYVNKQLKGLQEIANVDFNGIELFVIKSKEKK